MSAIPNHPASGGFTAPRGNQFSRKPSLRYARERGNNHRELLLFSNRRRERSLISTLVYQNYLAIPEFPEFIITAVEHDPTVFSRSLDAQIRALMIEPLSFAPPRLAPKLIIIDGLDECANPRAQKYILQALAAAATQLNVSVPFLVASRSFVPLSTPQHWVL